VIAKENKITSTVTYKDLSFMEHFSFSICSPVSSSEKQLSLHCAIGKVCQRFEGQWGATLKEKFEIICSISFRIIL